MNKHVYNVNLHGSHKIARQLVMDYISNLGGLKNATIGKELLQAARNPYFEYLTPRKKSGSQ